MGGPRSTGCALDREDCNFCLSAKISDLGRFALLCPTPHQPDVGERTPTKGMEECTHNPHLEKE
jgi:hypothetical protein